LTTNVGAEQQTDLPEYEVCTNGLRNSIICPCIPIKLYKEKKLSPVMIMLKQIIMKIENGALRIKYHM
jgi:hypothetical protein